MQYYAYRLHHHNDGFNILLADYFKNLASSTPTHKYSKTVFDSFAAIKPLLVRIYTEALPMPPPMVSLSRMLGK